MSQVRIRLAENGSDLALVYATWRNALWFAEKRDPAASDDFYREATQTIKDKLKTADARIAYLSEDPDMLLGWAVLTGTHLEFVYVKADYRRSGIARLLTQGFKTFSPPQTRIGRKLAPKYEQEKPHGRKEETRPSAQGSEPPPL